MTETILETPKFIIMLLVLTLIAWIEIGRKWRG